MTHATIAKPVSRPVPFMLARALATLEAPSLLDALRQAYGPERAEFEYESHPRRNREERQIEAANEMIDKAKAIAEGNGWDWSEVVAAAREDHHELF